MRAFAALFAELDASTSTAHKVDAMQRYFARAPAADAAWAAYFLAGGKPRQSVPTAVLRASACEAAGLDDWLFDACYQAVGDLAETIAHVLPLHEHDGDNAASAGLAEWVEQRLLPLRGEPPAVQADALRGFWRVLGPDEAFLLVKLIGGAFRVGVSKLLVQRALAQVAGVDAKLMAQRMMGYTDARSAPTPARYAALLAAPDAQQAADGGQPYPFFLAHQLDAAPGEFDARLGPSGDWLVEWKYDGIRVQAVKRAGRVWLWSRGEELVSETFPDAVKALAALPDSTVLDGELLVWPQGATQPAPFAQLQKRLNRKVIGAKLLADAPVRFVAYDLLEDGGADVRPLPQTERRARLEARLRDTTVNLSPLVHSADWPAYAQLREQSRERGVEGLMLKHRSAGYGSGRTKADGTWWKWKIDPMTADGVLVYAQAGHGRRASVYTDYTFAVWSRTPRDAHEAQAVVDAIERREPMPDLSAGALALVPFAKAYSGLSDEEFARVDRVIREHTVDKFGPVRTVKPSLVFELGFEGIARSTRHKSGIAVRFPRMLRIRDDKPLHEADTLATLRTLLDAA
ncbi:MAG TPA: cisplatin damage response ATP-dependent DNA ligase [Burkholderiaceae bacterium]|nr:cisplatin damage response ATP-dependent DNA ligase [Burkholderiaceae bacterium]